MASKAIIKHFGRIRGGIRIYYNDPLHRSQMEALEGKEFEEVIKEKSKRVSAEVHGYYRGGIIPACLASEMFGGWDEKEVHKFFQAQFLEEVIVKTLGDGTIAEIAYTLSTAELTQSQMSVFVDKVLGFCSQHNIVVQPPENYLYHKYKQDTQENTKKEQTQQSDSHDTATDDTAQVEP